MKKYVYTFLALLLCLAVYSHNSIAQVGVKFDNHEITDYISSMKSPSYTYLVWDLNSDGEGYFLENNRPKLFYWDDDDNEFSYLIDTKSMSQLMAEFHSMKLYDALTFTKELDQIRFETPGENRYYLLSKTKTTDNAFGLYSPDDGGWIFQVKEQTGNFILNNGNVGIGVTNPQYKLDIEGDIRIKYGSKFYVGTGTNKNLLSTGFMNSQDYVGIHVPGNTGDGTIKFLIKSDGNVGIGITNPQYKLTVDGIISASEIRVSNTPNSDYVFEPDYNLLPLTEVETFIKENKHLPEIPSAEEFKENGVGLGEMDDMLLRKVEELTLYLIEQEKELNMLSKENKKLREENINLKAENGEFQKAILLEIENLKSQLK